MGDIINVSVFALLALSCQRDLVKTWEEGGKLEAKISAEKCPDAGAQTAESKPRTVNGLCKVYGPNEFSAFAKMTIEEAGADHPGAPGPMDELWRVSCFKGVCDLATLSAFAFRETKPIEAFELSARLGKVVSQQGDVFRIRLDGQAEELLTVDLGARSLDYRQTFATGHKRIGRGSCMESTIDVPN